jgi:signal transduction histidine kinase
LDRLTRSDIDLAFLDLSMPEAQGLELLEKIRVQQPDLPVVVLSRLDDEALAVQAVREGAQDYLVKGHINAGVVLRVARYALERHRILARLRELDQVKSQFVSTVSHEMRTPLAIIREFVSLVRDGVAGPVSEQQDECLQSALRNCDRLTALITDLLDLSQIESGRLKLRRVGTDLLSVLRDCRDDFLPKCTGKRQQLSLDLPDSLPAVLSDPDKVRQVVVNLLGNAHKFSPEGGTIELRAQARPDGVVVSVQDDGIGISRNDQAAVFDAFTQIGRMDGPGAQGTGLGLTISRNIVQLHGGQLSVESAPGRGSCFAFSLPLYRPGQELTAFVEDRVRLYGAGRKRASLALLRAPDSRGLELLKRVAECAEATLRSSRDELLLVESEELLVCLIESDAAGSRNALRRLAETLEQRGLEIESLAYSVTEIRNSDPQDHDLSLASLASLRSLVAPEPCWRLLVVDDDDAMLHLIESVLLSADLDAELLLTSSAYEACIKFASFDPHLVILDIHMPDMDGQEALRSMLGARQSLTKFLVVSGNPSRFGAMLEMGCDACLAKPFDNDALIDKVSRMLNTKQGADVGRACSGP